ncbi:prolyl oligopeptidase family serine peptidase [Variovorax sp. ZS18.2.2]|uniref:prolyl oligopeptidase family serine peptidase n=1 Tax=Variovorax sp. ZS18.2.2 TaxID=2971255 RepID=UPI0021506E6F|nr:prolyl oligopeptidase family serine peptidase [Variovorax sp. ZS18.2.2]MCR6475336.1 prolyl oligopeptidase family serine peptidase [Variovorax sp. ZS18.2.2]
MTLLNRRQLALLALSQPLVQPFAAWAQDSTDLATALEQPDGAEALAWVQARTAEARQLITGLPDYTRRYEDTLSAVSARDSNIQFVRPHRGHLYNFYSTASQPSGVWRRTTLEEYRKERPSWQVLIDLDKLGQQEGRTWTFASYVLSPNGERALVYLSPGGADRTEMREFDLPSRQFVAAGFRLPLAKQWADWYGDDEVLVATESGGGALSRSGYPLTIRRWRRGSALAEAPELVRGEAADMSMSIDTLDPKDGRPAAALVGRRISFFQNRYQLLQGDTLSPLLDLPLDATTWLSEGWLVLWLRSDFDDGTARHPAGSVLATPIATATETQRRFHVLLSTAPRQRLIRWERVRDGFAMAWSDNLQPRLVFQRWTGETFESREVALPDTGVVGIRADRSDQNDLVWLTTQAPLVPQTFGLLDVAEPKPWAPLKRQATFFNAAGLKAQRLEARSADGTLIPYTVIAPAALAMDGHAPTLLYGYGGFGIALELDYQRLPGINWLRYGGVYVLAHIRGGGEFGSGWYEAAKGTRRQAAFDDFIAVAEDLVRRGITRPRRLGIYGASNGGALVSAVLVQRPELFGAAVARVPLTDMLEFTRFTAGPSWIEEYGDPAVAADRAVLARWSPLQNLREGVAYPPTLFIGNRNDDRVHPSHARKMVARMRTLGHAEAWLYEETSGGHLGRATPQLLATREALLHTFLMGMLQRKADEPAA